MGFPIRKSTDQRVFAPPRSLSQRITSFIACACQGIHQLPLRHLIVLIANAHPSAIPKELSPVAQSRRDCRLNRILCGIQSDVIGTKRPASRDRFEGAVRQTHHMQEIERLLRQITNLSAHEVRTNRLFTMSKQNKRQARRSPQTFFTNDLPDGVHLCSTPLLPKKKDGGAGRDRTDDILLAKQALSQLSYGP